MVKGADPSIFDMPLGYNVRRIFQDGYHHIAIGQRKVPLRLKDRQLVGAIGRLWNLPGYAQRVWLKARSGRRRTGVCRMRDGYALHRFTPGEIPGLERALKAADRKISTYLKVIAGAADPGERLDLKAYRAEMAKTDDDPLKHVPYRHDPEAAAALLRPFLSPQMYLVAADHLGLLPVLTGVRILYSPNAESDTLIRAQVFHTDPEGARQVKVFVAVRDVGPQNSPFTFIPEARTRQLRDSHPFLARKRLPDKAVLKRAPRSEWIEHIGRRGDMLFVDTSRCLHFGSRPNLKPRLLIYAQYLDPFCSIFPARKAGGDVGGGYGFYRTDDRIEQYLLGRR